MKKHLLILIAALLLISGCVAETVSSGGVVVRGASPTEPPSGTAIIVPNGEAVVYVTASGEKYHTADCPFLSPSCIPVALKQALQESKEACGQCFAAPDITPDATPVATPAETASAPPDETTVYVTKTGKKYHESGCSSLSSSRIPVSLEQALADGKEPCGRCHDLKKPLD